MNKYTYLMVGKKNKLDGLQLIRYVNYMASRWHKEEEMNCKTGYADEWAERFRKGIEYEASDLGGQAILKMIDIELGVEEEFGKSPKTK